MNVGARIAIVPRTETVRDLQTPLTLEKLLMKASSRSHAHTVIKISITPIIVAMSLLIGAEASYAQSSGVVCKKLPNGRLCMDKYHSPSGRGYHAWYVKTGGNPIQARFLLETQPDRIYKRSSYMKISAGKTGSYTWPVGNRGCGRAIMQVQGQGSFTSPWDCNSSWRP